MHAPTIGRPRGLFTLSAVLASALTTAGLAHDEIDFGRTAASQLATILDLDMPISMEVSPFSELPGWVKVDLGMASLTDDRPDLGIFIPSSSSFVKIRLVAADEGLRMWKAGLSAPLGIGESYDLGNPAFHNHPVFQIDHLTGAEVYSITFVAEDSAGLYADSEPFTVTFKPVPTPGGVLLVVGGVCVAGMKKPRRRGA